MPQPAPPDTFPGLCSHVFPATPTAPARPCGSPALRGQSFCYYHHPARTPAVTRAQRRALIRARQAARRVVTLQFPTTRDELVHAIYQVMALIAANQIDLRRASRLLTALRTAGSHLRE